MTKNIGLSQKIKLEWLNEITSMLLSKADEKLKQIIVYAIVSYKQDYLNIINGL